jgi:hypothetical protein
VCALIGYGNLAVETPRCHRGETKTSDVTRHVGGKGDVRSMEGMLQQIAQVCADVLEVDVKLTSELVIEPRQVMRVTCFAFPGRS